MTGGGKRVNGAVAQIDFGDSIGPGGESEEFADGIEVGTDDLDVGNVLELRIAEAMIEMAMGVNDKEGKFRGGCFRQQG